MITVCSCFWRSAFSACSFVSAQTSMMISSNTLFRRATWRGHFWLIPLRRLLCVQLEIDKCRCFPECLPYILFTSASPSASCDCSAILRIAFGPCVTHVAFCLVSFLQILTTLFSNDDGSCEFCKMQMMRSCVFEILCWVVWEVESWSSWYAQVLPWRLFSQRSWPEAMSQYHIFDSCFWFVWFVCWSVCCVTGDVSDEFISHSFVAEWRDEIFFGLFLWGVCSLCEWQVQPNVRPLPSSVLPFLLFFRFFYELIMFLARCRFFVLVRSTPCVNGQFIQHFLWRATWQDHHEFFSLCSLLSVRVASATDCLPVVVRACSIKCCDGGAACSIV